ncbi:MAG: cation:proton antiporter [Myxococcales bacterium]|nr:MAG: cation:proton antiporter [Myxococcales bacterium]
MYFSHPYVTLALAIAAGIVAQVIAAHIRMPSIVLLLLVGVLLGPDLAGWLAPSALGDGLSGLVSFAVAVILFEGGLHLSLARLKREQKAIRRLVTLGAFVTAVTGTLCAKLFMGWPWTLSALFGSLVIVSGPTVIKPLLQRLQVKTTVSTILEAEGVLIDAIGAITAVVVLEVVLRPTGLNAMSGVMHILGRLAFGISVGFLSGWCIVYLWRFRWLVPESLENVVTLALVLLVFQVCNISVHESGIAAVTVAGMVVANISERAKKSLLEFKEQLSALFIGALFVLLAADVRLSEIYSLGIGAVFTVLAVILLVRPACVVASTRGTSLDWKQKLFIAWIGPRGIVAAAVASLFASELDVAHMEGGADLKALVFVVIASTVVVAGLSGGIVARLLGLRRKTDHGWVIVGANDFGLTLAGLLRNPLDPIVFIESNPRACKEAEAAGFGCVYGNALKEEALQLAKLDIRRGLLACTSNEQTNFLAVQHAKHLAKQHFFGITTEDLEVGVSPQMVSHSGAKLLFASAVDVQRWSQRIRHEEAEVQWWRAPKESKVRWPANLGATNLIAVPLVVYGKDCNLPVYEGILRPRMLIAWLVETSRAREIREIFEEKGWSFQSEPPQA